MRAYVEEHGDITDDELQSPVPPGLPSRGTVAVYCGSVAEARVAIGLPPRGRGGYEREMVTKTCANRFCGVEFPGEKRGGTYCKPCRDHRARNGGHERVPNDLQRQFQAAAMIAAVKEMAAVLGSTPLVQEMRSVMPNPSGAGFANYSDLLAAAGIKPRKRGGAR